MGYRSEVALCLSNNGVKAMRKKLRAKPKNVRDFIRNFFKFADVHLEHAETGTQFWLWKWCKWNNEDSVTFPEVEFVENLMRSTSAQDYFFLRSGEELGDDEVHGDLVDDPFDLYIKRSIHFVNAA